MRFLDDHDKRPLSISFDFSCCPLAGLGARPGFSPMAAPDSRIIPGDLQNREIGSPGKRAIKTGRAVDRDLLDDSCPGREGRFQFKVNESMSECNKTWCIAIGRRTPRAGR